ncbi:MAG: 16S rRNA (adenine(1518)-N(6)/adenine(1519)-N(6))-dimethyltransferase RsmA [Clostridia bacterium]|nr:16S rRNA (adenine(1518)-N(6)/adenine(1519)-N(6))-dimethyltransferase RsmA [Clostridia bacterium]
MPALTDKAYVESLLTRHGFSFSKALGQNFLINPSVCPRMAQACGVGPEGTVLEIGPGIGVLTRELAQRAGRVLAVELDERLRPVLAETLADCPNVEVIYGDAMQMDLAALLREKGAGPAAVCANLPYYITSPLIMRLLESRLPVQTVTVLVQKEAADRLCAQPGTRESGAVTLAVAYYAAPEKLFRVSAGSFLPAPKVDSTAISLHIRPRPPVETDPDKLFAVVRAAFGQRRKTLCNALQAGGYDKTAVAQALRQLSLPAAARAEQLTLAQMAALAAVL